jgi:two-component system response regulator AtoC
LDELTRLMNRIGPRKAFETLTQLLPDAAVFSVDENREIISWSSGAERMLGFSAEEAIGKLCLSSIRCRACTLGCGISRNGSVRDFPLELYRADDRWVATRKFAQGFFDDRGHFIGGIEVLFAQDGQPAKSKDFAAGFRPPIDAENFHGLVSRDPEMRRVFQSVRNVGETDSTVLIEGESGSGKELVARAIHNESRRHLGPFVAVNCAALSPGLIESELFGHVKGAFTGSHRDRKGVFERAHTGTLFLDEVGELPLDVQSKLLRVIEERVVTPVGSSEERGVDLRMVAATHRDIASRVGSGQFRADLMYRLRVVPIVLPPLRARDGDIELLLRHFLSHFNDQGPRRIETIEPSALEALTRHHWPGNLRELRNVVEHAFAIGRGETLSIHDLPAELGREVSRNGPCIGRGSAESSNERNQIAEALRLEPGSLTAAAQRLGISRSTLWRKRRRYGL